MVWTYFDQAVMRMCHFPLIFWKCCIAMQFDIVHPTLAGAQDAVSEALLGGCVYSMLLMKILQHNTRVENRRSQWAHILKYSRKVFRQFLFSTRK
jgi:hypothetical protein